MPQFLITTEDGQKYKVTADSFEDAQAALETEDGERSIGYGRAAAQGALIDAPQMLGSVIDLLNPYEGMRRNRNATPDDLSGLVLGRNANPVPSFAERGKSMGESMIGPRQTGSVGEERLARAVRGGLVGVPAAIGAGPVGLGLSVLGGAAGDVTQMELERRGVGTGKSLAAGAAVDIGTSLLGRNLPRAAKGVAGLFAKEAVEEVATEGVEAAAKEAAGEGAEAVAKESLTENAEVVSRQVIPQGWMEETLEDGSSVIRPRPEAIEATENFVARAIPSRVRMLPGDSAGNINLTKLDTPDGVKQVIEDVANQYGDFMGARRGVVSQQATKELADDLGWGVDDLTKHKGRALLAHEIEAGRRVLLATGTELDSARGAVLVNPSVENQARAIQALTRHVAVQESMAGYAAEAGRTLNILRKASTIKNDALRMQQIIKEAGGTDRIVTVMRMMEEMPSSAAANAFGRAAVKPTTGEKLIEAWKANLLTNPTTHVVNAMSNAGTQALTMAEDVVSSLGRAATGDKAALYGIAGRLYGAKSGLADGLEYMYRALRAEDALASSRSMETAGAKVGAIGGRLGKAVRIPFRLLTASDQLFRTLATRSKAHQIAAEEAARTGLKGQALWDEAARLVNHPDTLDKAEKFGSYAVFQAELGTTGSAIQRAIQSHPSLQVVVPFFKTPTNILKFTMERLPTHVLTKSFRDAWKAGGVERADALARIGMGSSIMGGAVMMAVEGRITGGGPRDPAERAAWMNEKKPYSVKVGDQWVSYARMEPIASLMGMAADFTELYSRMTDDEREKVALQLIAIPAYNMTSKSYVQGMSRFMLAAMFPERYGEAFAEGLTGSLIPTGVAHIARTSDPVMRETNTLLDSIRARIPGQRSQLTPKIDSITGEEVILTPAVGPDIASPIYSFKPKNDPVAMELVKLRAGVGAPGDTIKGEKMSPQEYEAFSRQAGQEGHKRALRVISTMRYRRMTDEDKAEAIRSEYEKSRALARQRVLRERRRAGGK